MSEQDGDLEHVHIVPITHGDRETVYPITRDELPATEVVAYYLDGEPNDPFVEYAIDNILGLPLTTKTVEGGAFGLVRETVLSHLEAGATVYLNATELSGEYLSVFTATNTVQFERPEDRENVRVYVANDDGHSDVTTVPDPEMTETGEKILVALSDSEYSSISQLAESLHNGDGTKFESFRSRVQYNTQELAAKGYVQRNENGNAFTPELTPTGERWVTDVINP